MNNDFETDLERSIAAMTRHDPTPAWKESILHRATTQARSKICPRWLLVSWVGCWVVIFCLSITTPRSSMSPSEKEVSLVHPSSSAKESPLTLLAFQRRLELNIDIVP